MHFALVVVVSMSGQTGGQIKLGAKKIATFRALFQSLGFHKDNVIVVSDVEGEDGSECISTPEKLISHLKTEVKSRVSGGVLMTFVVTHGVRLLTPEGSEPGLCLKQSRYSEMANAWTNVLPVRTLGETLRGIGAESVFLVLEACHGAFGDEQEWRTEVEGFTQISNMPHFLRKPATEESIKGMYLLFSTSSEEKGYEGSHLTKFIEECLSGRGRVDEKGNVRASHFVLQLCRDMPHPPHLSAWRMDKSQDFVLSPRPVADFPICAKSLESILVNDCKKDIDGLLNMIKSKVQVFESISIQESEELTDVISRMENLMERIKEERKGMDEGCVDYGTPSRISSYSQSWATLVIELGAIGQLVTLSKLEELRMTQKTHPEPSNVPRPPFLFTEQTIVLAPPTLSTEQTCIDRTVEVAELISRLSKPILGTVGLHGMGGIGKTVLAYILYHTKEVRDQFNDGIFWITIGQDVNTAAILRYQTKLYIALNEKKDSEFSSVTEAQSELESIITKKSCLIILDDVWNGQVCKRFGSNIQSNSKILVTTRDSTLFGRKSKDIMYDLEYLNREEAIILLACESGIEKEDLQENGKELNELLEQCDKNPIPLVVSVVGGMLGEITEDSDSVQDCLKEVASLIKGQWLAHRPTHESKTLFSVLMGSLEVLSRDPNYSRYSTTSLFLDLSIFPEDYEIPVGLIEWLWSMRGVPKESSRDLIRKICRVSLMQRNMKEGKPIVKLHDSVRKFAQFAVEGVEHDKEKLKDLHRFLISSYESKGADNEIVDEYMLGRLTYHLNETEQYERIFELLTSLEWIYKRGVAAVLFEDCQYLSKIEKYRDAASMLESALRMSAGPVSKYYGKEELAFQLRGRLRRTSNEKLREFAKRLKKVSRLEWLVGKGVLHAAGGRLIRIFSHNSSVESISVTPDGKHLISGSGDGIVRTWDINSGECESELKAHAGLVRSVAVSLDGKYICSGSSDETVKVHDREGRELFVLKEHTNYVNSVAFSPCGKYICSGSGDKTLRLWNSASGICERVFEGHNDFVYSVAFCPDKRHIVSGSKDKTLRVWDMVSGQCESELNEHSDEVNSVAVSPDGMYIISGSDDNTIRVFNMPSRNCKQVLRGHTDDVWSVAVTSDNKIVSSSRDGTVMVWDLHKNQFESSFPVSGVWSLAVGPHDHYIFTGSIDSTAKMLSLRREVDDAKIDAHSGYVCSLAISPDGSQVATGSGDKTARLWDMNTGACNLLLKGDGKVWSMVFSPDGKQIFTGSEEKTIRVWNSFTGECKSVLTGHISSVRSLAVSSDGNHLISGSWYSEVRRFDLKSGKSKILIGRVDDFTPIEVYSCHKLAVYGSFDGKVRVYCLVDGMCKSVLDGHTKEVHSAAVSADGNTIITSSAFDNTLRVWCLSTSQCLSELAHPIAVTRVAFSPDGYIISGSRDGKVRVWDTETKKVIWIRCFDGPITLISVHGNMLVVGLGYGAAVLNTYGAKE